MSEQVVEYTIRMTKQHADELARMSEYTDEDDELVYLENCAVSFIEEKELATDFQSDFVYVPLEPKEK